MKEIINFQLAHTNLKLLRKVSHLETLINIVIIIKRLQNVPETSVYCVNLIAAANGVSQIEIFQTLFKLLNKPAAQAADADPSPLKLHQ